MGTNAGPIRLAQGRLSAHYPGPQVRGTGGTLISIWVLKALPSGAHNGFELTVKSADWSAWELPPIQTV